MAMKPMKKLLVAFSAGLLADNVDGLYVAPNTLRAVTFRQIKLNNYQPEARWRPSNSALFPHQFNGGYDAGRGVHWNPLEAAEFLLWHAGEAGEAGKQLRPLIEHWRGSDAGEFLTRLYLGETNEEEFKLSFESRNVRNPQWKGLDDEDGLKALKDLLSSALPDEVLAPAEIARLADSFLLKEHTWPARLDGEFDEEESTNHDDGVDDDKQTTSKSKSKKEQKRALEKDSFASRGYTTDLAKILGALRSDRFGEFLAPDVLDMVLLPERNISNETGFLHMHEFFTHIGIRLTPSEKVDIVRGMAQGGLGPSSIAKFVSQIEEIPESSRPNLLRSDKTSEKQKTIVITKTQGFPSPFEKSPRPQDAEDTKESLSDEKFKSLLPSPFYLGATQAYFSEHQNQEEPKRSQESKTSTSR